jgi:predicted DNA binding CopG/RHH family protein
MLDMMKSAILFTRLEEEIAKKVKAKARDHGLTASEYLRYLIVRSLEGEKHEEGQ